LRCSDATQTAGGALVSDYAPPGHLPVFVAGTEIVEFSPTEEFRRTATAVLDNAAAR